MASASHCPERGEHPPSQRSLRVVLLFYTEPRRAFSSSVAALAPVVRAAGHHAEAIEIFREYKIDHVAAHLREMAPDVLAISAMTRDWPGAHALLDRLDFPRRGSRASEELVLAGAESGEAGQAEASQTGASRADGPYVVVGGYHASLAPQEVAECARVDAVCIGEGERPLRRLLDALAQGRAPTASYEGLWVRGDGREGEAGFSNAGFPDPIPSSDTEPNIETLLPWDYEVFGDVTESLQAGINTFGPLVDGFLPTRAGRGCPFSCAYCSAPRWGALGGFRRTQNTRSVDHLCDELASLRDRYSPEGFEFWDEHFPVAIEWLEEFAETYPARVGLPFKVEMHPNAATRQRLELLKKAGCSLFHCGIEAGDESFRRSVLQRRTPDVRLQAVFDDCRAIGLETSASLMTMLPGETRAQQAKTTQLLHRLRPGSFMWSNYHPLPGTPLGEAAVAHWPGPAREKFNDYDQVISASPPSVTDGERDQTFRELGALQASLVRKAAAKAKQRAIDEGRGTPWRARPIEVPPAMESVKEELATLLGWGPATVSPLVAESVCWERGLMRLVVRHADFGAAEIRIDDGQGGAFLRTAQLGISYAGKEAHPTLLDALQHLQGRLGSQSLQALREAQYGADDLS